MQAIQPSGFCTLKEIAAYYGTTSKTMGKKLKDLSIFFEKKGERKRTYAPNEVELILNTFGEVKGS